MARNAALTLVPELAALDALPDFDDRKIGKTSIKVTNAGDGLSEALQVDPEAFHLGATVYVVLACSVSKIEHMPMKDSDPETGALERSHTLRAGDAAIVDAAVVKTALASQAEKLRIARERAQGIEQLRNQDGSDPWDDGPNLAADSPMYDDDPEGDDG